MSQAEHRCHRIRQADSVPLWHVVQEGSVDERLAHTVVAKQAVTAALDFALPPAAGEVPPHRMAASPPHPTRQKTSGNRACAAKLIVDIQHGRVDGR